VKGATKIIAEERAKRIEQKEFSGIPRKPPATEEDPLAYIRDLYEDPEKAYKAEI